MKFEKKSRCIPRTGICIHVTTMWTIVKANINQHNIYQQILPNAAIEKINISSLQKKPIILDEFLFR